MLKSVHASAPQPEGFDHFERLCDPSERILYESRHPSVQLTKAAQTRPLKSEAALRANGHNNHPIDMAAVERIVARGTWQEPNTQVGGHPGRRVKYDAMQWQFPQDVRGADRCWPRTPGRTPRTGQGVEQSPA
jgi:hypothetical protein